jgi:hypothetical protein
MFRPRGPRVPPMLQKHTETNMLNRPICALVAALIAAGLLTSAAEARSNGVPSDAGRNGAMVRPGPQPGGNLLHIKNKKVIDAVSCAVRRDSHYYPCGYF